jgi:hypothetical protein
VLHAQERAKDIGVEGGGVGKSGLLGHWPWLALSAGVVDRHVQTAEALDSQFEQVANVLLVTESCSCRNKYKVLKDQPSKSAVTSRSSSRDWPASILEIIDECYLAAHLRPANAV